MDSRLLRCFLAVVENGSMTAAAGALHVTQPALSKSIQRLEQELGVELFERHVGGVVPTRYGEALARRAKLIDFEFRNARAEIEAMKEGNAGTISIGAGPLWTVLYLPKVIAALRRQQPRVKIRLVSAVLDTLIPQLLEGGLDLVCAALDFPDHSDIVKDYLFDVEHIILSRANHPLSSKPSVEPADLLSYSWVALINDYIGMTRVASYFSANGLEQPTIAVESNSLEGVFSMLREGDFIASVSAPLLNYAKAMGLTSLPVKGTFWRFRAGIAYRRSARTTPVVDAVIADLKSQPHAA